MSDRNPPSAQVQVTLSQSSTPEEQQADNAPPPKRGRRVLNCQPCRTSKLKCDRNRPCSSCVLRGTASLCYQDNVNEDDMMPNWEDDTRSRIHVAQEIAHLRYSTDQLETYLQRQLSQGRIPPRGETSSISAPGILRFQGRGQFYAGATSVAFLLPKNPNAEEDQIECDDQPDQETLALSHDYDRDLIDLLPSLEIIDQLLDYHFLYCTWITPLVNRDSFFRRWEMFKNGHSTDRITLSTVCALIALTVSFLPAKHNLLGVSDSPQAMAEKYYEISSMALHRRENESKVYTLDLVELMLVRTHYLSQYRKDCEEAWTGTGELIRTGIAIGLHRDPGKWRIHRDEAERRRWAWWHIIAFERWQAFILGRPTAVARHHWDTRFPSYCHPSLDKTGRLYLPNLALFKLTDLLGDIIDDSLSTRPVAYANVQANDRALRHWLEELPTELEMNEYQLARNLVSTDVSIRRLAVQSLSLRTSFHLIRLTLHRPYTCDGGPPGRCVVDDQKLETSLEIAINNAERLIKLIVVVSNQDSLAPEIGGYSGWQLFHCFAAAMFFSFQLIREPDQHSAELMRSNIHTAIETLRHWCSHRIADKANEILLCLAPLYSSDFLQQAQHVQEKERARILTATRQLAFPYPIGPNSSRGTDLQSQYYDTALQTYTLYSSSTPAYLQECSSQEMCYMPPNIQLPDASGLRDLNTPWQPELPMHCPEYVHQWHSAYYHGFQQ